MNKELQEIILEDKKYYYGEGMKYIYRLVTRNPLYQRGRYIIIARKAGYYKLHADSLINKILQIYYVRKKNVLGEKIGIELGPNEFGKRIRICDNNIVINAGAIIGDDCELYGDNCIGNKSSNSMPLDAPILGNKVSIGVGTKIIGKLKLQIMLK